MVSSSKCMLLSASIAIGVAGCSKSGATKDRATVLPAEPRNVVLITLDACRADILSCYGHPRSTSPRMDALASQGVLFENAVTPATSTLPSHCSILTGTIPPFHGVHADANYRLPKINVTLAETLKARGFATGAFVGSPALHSMFGLPQGFDTYDEDFSTSPGGLRSAKHVTDSALKWITLHAKDRMFVLINYQDPAVPYTPPETYRAMHDGNAYLGELSYTDAQIGRVIDKLDALGLADSTLIVVTGAHGEGAGNHSESWHGFFVYHDTNRVPLIIKMPGAVSGARIQEKVGVIDIVPTVLSLLRVTDAPPVHGSDLSPFLTGRTTAYSGRYFYTESLLPTVDGCNALFAIEDQSWKYIQSNRPELYDLAGDPGETKNLLLEQPNRSRAMQQRLKQELAATIRISETGDAFSGGAGALTFETGKEDPKDFIRIYDMLVMTWDLFNRRDREGVASMCDTILKIRPDVSRAHELLGEVTEFDQREKKKNHFLDALKHNPSSALAHFSLGNVFARDFELPAAELYFEKAQMLEEGSAVRKGSLIELLTSFGYVPPLRFKARLHLADVYHYQRNFDAAIESYYIALFLDPLTQDTPFFRQVKARAFAHLGQNLYFRNRFEDSVNACQDALALDSALEEAKLCIDRALTALDVLGSVEQRQEKELRKEQKKEAANEEP